MSSDSQGSRLTQNSKAGMKVETPFPMAFQMQPTRQGEEEELQVRHAGVGVGSEEPAPSVGLPACSMLGVMGRHSAEE